MVALHFAEPAGVGPPPPEEHHSASQISPVPRPLYKSLEGEEEEAPQMALEHPAALVASRRQQPAEPEAQPRSPQLLLCEVLAAVPEVQVS